jgi:hypothetical protein
VLAPKIKILRSWLVMSKEQAKLWVEKNAIKETVKYKAEANMKEAKLQGYIENGSYIALVETVASGNWGCKMPEALVPFFELDITPNDEWVWEAIDGFSSDLASVLLKSWACLEASILVVTKPMDLTAYGILKTWMNLQTMKRTFVYKTIEYFVPSVMNVLTRVLKGKRLKTT